MSQRQRVLLESMLGKRIVVILAKHLRVLFAFCRGKQHFVDHPGVKRLASCSHQLVTDSNSTLFLYTCTYPHRAIVATECSSLSSMTRSPTMSESIARAPATACGTAGRRRAGQAAIGPTESFISIAARILPNKAPRHLDTAAIVFRFLPALSVPGKKSS